jgi:hypothetical protein
MGDLSWIMFWQHMGAFIKSRINENLNLVFVQLNLICIEPMTWLKGFLWNMINKLGFNSQWIDLVMACVFSLSHYARYNSQMIDFFSLQLEVYLIRDPLSPYLFLMCSAKGFLICLLQKENVGVIEGVDQGVQQYIINFLIYSL